VHVVTDLDDVMLEEDGDSSGPVSPSSATAGGGSRGTSTGGATKKTSLPGVLSSLPVGASMAKDMHCTSWYTSGSTGSTVLQACTGAYAHCHQ
jgi:hypothetical protein